jgi:hypothetical protein
MNEPHLSFQCSLTCGLIREKSSLLNEVMMVLITWLFLYEIWHSQLPSNEQIFASLVLSHEKQNTSYAIGCVPKQVKLGCGWVGGERGGRGGISGGLKHEPKTWHISVAKFRAWVLACDNPCRAAWAWATHLRCVAQITSGPPVASHSPFVSNLWQTLTSMARILAKSTAQIYFCNARGVMGNFPGGKLVKFRQKKKRWIRYNTCCSQVVVRHV